MTRFHRLSVLTIGAVLSMTLSVARVYIGKKIRCNCISPARVHTPFVDGFVTKNYPGHEEEMFAKLSASQPIGRMAEPSEIALLALYLGKMQFESIIRLRKSVGSTSRAAGFYKPR